MNVVCMYMKLCVKAWSNRYLYAKIQQTAIFLPLCKDEFKF